MFSKTVLWVFGEGWYEAALATPESLHLCRLGQPSSPSHQVLHFKDLPRFFGQPSAPNDEFRGAHMLLIATGQCPLSSSPGLREASLIPLGSMVFPLSEHPHTYCLCHFLFSLCNIHCTNIYTMLNLDLKKKKKKKILVLLLKKHLVSED